MTSPIPYGVFISYSHEDAKLVTPLVRLLRYERDDLIFHDKNDIRDGELWEPQLLQRLGEVHTVMVFWCKHSAQSEYVRKEYLQGIAQQKKILPIILDETKMATELAAYQGIDFRESAIHQSYSPAPAPPKTFRSKNLFLLFSVVLCILAILFMVLTELPWWVDVLVAIIPTFIIVWSVVMTDRTPPPLSRKKSPAIKPLDKQLQEANITADFPRPLAQQVLQRLNEMMPASSV